MPWCDSNADNATLKLGTGLYTWLGQSACLLHLMQSSLTMGYVKMGASANQQQECTDTVCTRELTPEQSI